MPPKKNRSTRRSTTTARHGTTVFDRNTTDDNISRLLDAKRLVPERFRDTDEFLDVVSWNIRWFDHQDPVRVQAIADVLGAINADVFVLTEIAEDGALDEVINRLAQARAGFYSREYGKTGAQQRVVFLWDRDWVRTKQRPRELFVGEKLTVPGEFGTKRQAVFPRLPLWAYFEALPPDNRPGSEGFTFELVGVHLKAQGPAPRDYTGPAKDRWGIPQRTAASKRLARWLTTPAEHADTDVIITGDWNATPGQPEWAKLRALEKRKEIKFTGTNNENEPTHLVRLNASGPAGTRLDLHLVTDEASASAVPDHTGVVIRWSPFDHLSTLGSAQRQQLFKRLKYLFSDHLPVVSRFYLTDGGGS